MNINKIKVKLREVIETDIQLIEKGNGLLLVETNFYFPDGDPYQIYLQELPTGDIRVTDCGHTLMHLSYENDISYENDNELLYGQILDKILARNAINKNDGELYVDCSIEQLDHYFFRFHTALRTFAMIFGLLTYSIKNICHDFWSSNIQNQR